MSLEYTLWDNYLSQSKIWEGIEEYYENTTTKLCERIEKYCEISLTKLCERYFKVPDGLEPGNAYIVRNIEIYGFSILRFTVETRVFPDFDPEGMRHIIVLGGLLDFEGEWFPLPSALAG